MKIYFPYYYKDFKCIADRCRHSCCVGWEIDVDDETVSKYDRLDGAFGEEIRSHISDDGVIELCEDERCPFLDGCGLCRIISTLGENYISDICREHPRFYHTVRGRTEGGIGAVCEEACRIILSSDGYTEFIEAEREIDSPYDTDFDTAAHRDFIFSLLFNDILDYDGQILELRRKYNLPDPRSKSEQWNNILSELEYLNKSRVGLLTVGKRDGRKEMKGYLTRFLAYLIFRHVSVAENYDNLRARVGFSLLLTAIFENMIAERDLTFEEIVEAARIISEEIEYSEDNTASLILEIESRI